MQKMRLQTHLKNYNSFQYLIKMYINHCKNRSVDLTNPYIYLVIFNTNNKE